MLKYNLIMTQGNSQSYTVKNKDRSFEEGDRIIFSVKNNYYDDEYLLKKETTDFDNDLATINILPKDTANIKPGQYVYDIQFNSFDGAVQTIFKGDFILDWRVTDE